MSEQEAVQKLQEELWERGNHKLEKLDDPGMYAIVRKNAKYAFGMNFELIQELGFKLSHMQNYNGKDEVIIIYEG